jgi:hypothetical protein
MAFSFDLLGLETQVRQWDMGKNNELQAVMAMISGPVEVYLASCRQPDR